MNEEQIHDLIARSCSEILSEEERAVLSSWRAASSTNERCYQETLRIWELTAGLKPDYIPDTDKHWKDLLIKMEAEPRTGRVKFLSRGSSFYKVAAAVVLVASLGYIMLHFSTLLLKEITTKQTASHMDVFYLPDSSIVWLNKNSRLTFPEEFDADQRVVYLEGEAFFDVRKNPHQPFIIHAGATTTKVLGTSFDVKAYQGDKEVSVTVITGKVAFSTERQTLLLLPQQTGIYTKAKQEITLRKKADEIKSKRTDQNNDRYAVEFAQPHKYLHNSFTSRTNLINQTVIEGEIENKAKVCSYHDLYLKVVYISSRNNTYEQYFRIENQVNPGEKVVYKQKLPDWFIDTEEVKVTIEEVKGVIF
jgi:transmembrane sensor